MIIVADVRVPSFPMTPPLGLVEIVDALDLLIGGSLCLIGTR